MSEQFILQFERVVSIAPEKLFAGWTDAKFFKKWFAIMPMKLTDVIIEPEVGGAFEMQLKGPGFKKIPRGIGCILEIEQDRKLVWTNKMKRGSVPVKLSTTDIGMVVSVEFIAQDEGTLYKVSVEHDSKIEMETNRKMGFDQGWSSTLNKLVKLMK